ncbi:hypothetical protein DIPPA_12583 [Diplonema papillatum]|nr:hypothetical protein DIPPA_12583 [Diplonema papillatum]
MLRPFLLAVAVAHAAGIDVTLDYDMSAEEVHNSFCRFATHLNGTAVMPDVKCCEGVPVESDAECDSDINGNLTYDIAQSIVTYDCRIKSPAVVFIMRTTLDVQRTIVFLKHYDIEFTTRSGGHAQSCASTCDGCAVIHLFEMKNTTVYESLGDTYMIVEPGITIGDLIEAYRVVDFVLPHAPTRTLGIGGHSTGGGMGDLTRWMGFLSDRIMGVEIVLKDGDVARIFDTDHEAQLAEHKLTCPDAVTDKRILWAMKGSGHIGLGVVTKLYLHMLPKPKFVVHGAIRLPMFTQEDAKRFFDIPCAYFKDARDERPGDKENRLQCWTTVVPIQDVINQRPYSISYRFTYFAEATTKEAAWEEGLAEINGTFFKDVDVTPTANSLDVYEYNDVYPPPIPGSNPTGSADGTCASKVIVHKNDVCMNETYLEEFSAWLIDMVQVENWQPYGNFPFASIEKWGGRASWEDRWHIKGSMSTRHAWAAMEGCFWRTNKSLPRTEVLSIARDFNQRFLRPISTTYYANYANFNVESEEDLFPIASIRNRLRRLKKKYDPTNVFSKDDSEYNLSD